MIDNRIGNIARGAARGLTARVDHLLLLVSLGAAIPAAAQDSLGMASDNLDAAASFAGTIGVNSHLDGDDRASVRKSPVRVAPTPQQRAACGNLKRFTAEQGASDPRVQFVARQCRARGL